MTLLALPLAVALGFAPPALSPWSAAAARGAPSSARCALGAPRGVDAPLGAPQEPNLGGGPLDPWGEAQRAPDGPERTAALVRALSAAAFAPLAPQARFERLDVAYRAFLSAEERIAADELLALAQAMYDRDPAIWSGFCLEGALRRGFGRYAEADALLASLAARFADDPAAVLALTERRTLIAAGAGDAARERALLGSALGAGSLDARQILGFAALRAGDDAAALAHFSVLVGAPAPAAPAAQGASGGADTGDQAPSAFTPTPARDLPPWALRGFGIALLPRKRP
ncbi:MAG: hypothetical protein R3F49_20340 [Planctomycetota bacterium]